MTAPILELQQVCFSHTGSAVPLLNHVNVRLDHGQRIGLIGPNGSGKTTLLHLLVGLYLPEAGTLFFKGNPVKTKDDYIRVRQSVGLVFQDADDQLFSPTVLEDVAFGPLNLGIPPEEAVEISRQTLSSLNLSHLAERVTHKLSGGEKKLVSLATILSMQPEAILLDEPTNNLDPATKDKVIEIINSLKIASIIISHDWDFLAETCKTLYALDQGHAIQSNTACLHIHRHAHSLGNQPHKHK